MKPLISVIVPVYNGQDYLSKCIESIEAQTYQNLEVIIINDGSTDGTEKVCQRLKKKYENIYLITLNDEGVSAARNAGIDASGGEFITFVDADDRLLAKAIELLHDSLIKTESSIAGCGFWKWKDEEELKPILGNSFPLERERTYTASEFLKDEILKGNSRCWSKLYKRSVIGDVRFREDLTIGEDMLFLIDLLPRAERIVEIPYKGYGYFQNPRGAMNRTFLPKYMDQITCWEIAREEIEKRNLPELKKEEKVQIESQITLILLMAIMLTAGKLALLSAADRKQHKQYIDICHEKIKKEVKVAGAYEGLSKGYQLKVRLFRRMPALYLWLYHFRKYKKN